MIGAMVLSSCATGGRSQYRPKRGAAATGAAIGGSVGNIIGGNVGYHNNGWRGGRRGSSIGTVVGAVAGAAIGSAVSSAAQNNRQAPVANDYVKVPRQKKVPQSSAGALQSSLYGLTIQNIRFIDDNRNQVIDAGESSQIIFDIVNESNQPVYNVIPVVEAISSGKNIEISQSLMIEDIGANDGIRYTANLYADKRLKTGEVIIRIEIGRASCRERVLRLV